MKNMDGYHDHFLKKNVLLLAEVLEKFIDTCMKFLVCSLKRASLTLIKQVDEDAIIKSCPVKYVFS